ncbi:uncharacterized protein LOC110007362 isoform X2 [Amborella trichopoda]|uniref:Uncharacterized protein n=2 Tax=Amborella trichopoda TaxID=13333 RepID=W1PIA8_AMBTC|nr:uncharacterized protein LOC110007362 isoform X2 [Amborella trichopoda]XP_020523527.1 uncharacterized protein LOC110007362 isoform X2 [Amborella trichopoda]ERN07366.1 hypothetical protein AMTR_s00019p00236850 [Amborella trichopoda]|eukprot:XP_020523526.1 uncharacterized protein LOC110007362 isoform X2 [Amborella trichopoda]
MGTKVQHVVNLGTNLCEGNTDEERETRVRGRHTWALFADKGLLNTGFPQLQQVMERFQDQHSRESVKNTMLKHEEIFKEQVRELHRLYRVQKSLMSELKKKEFHQIHSPSSSSTPLTRLWGSGISPRSSNSEFLNRLSLTEPSVDYNYQGSRERNYKNFHEIRSCSRDKGIDLERPAEDYDPAEALATNEQNPLLGKIEKSKFKNESTFFEPERDLQLTLCTGYHNRDHQKNEKEWLGPKLELGYSHKAGRPSASDSYKSSCSERSMKGNQDSRMVESGDECSENLKKPPWPFQVLNLNRT